MKPKIELFLNSIGLLILSPIMGMMALGLAVGVIEAIIWTLAGASGFIASIFFDVDFMSIHSRLPIIRQAEIWIIFLGGTLGGLIWSFLEIHEKWMKYKKSGKGW